MTDWSSSWSPWPRPTLWGMRLTHHPSCAQSNLLGTFHRKASKSLYLQAGTMHILGLRMVWIIAVHREEREALECSQGLISPFTVGRRGARHGYIRLDAPRGVRNRPRLSWSGWSMCWVTCNCNPGVELQNRWYCGYYNVKSLFAFIVVKHSPLTNALCWKNILPINWVQNWPVWSNSSHGTNLSHGWHISYMINMI